MKPEQQRAILEAAAKACCYTPYWNPSLEEWQKDLTDPYVNGMVWNPIDNSADTASMCAKLNINYTWMCGYVECWKWDGPSIKIEHDDTDADKEAAWRLASSIVAAKIGGYTDE